MIKPFHIIFLSLVTSFLGAYAVVSWQGTGEVPLQEKQETAYERVMRTGVLRCGYVIYTPSFIKDPNTKEMSGILYEITEQMAQKLGWQVDWSVETSFADFPEELKTEKIDAMCSGAWAISGRAHHVDYTRPLWYSAVAAWVANGNNKINTIEDINTPEIKISAVDGTIPFFLAKEKFPKAEILSMPTLSDYTLNLLNVENGKADVTFVEVYQGNDYLNKNPNTIKNITTNQPITVYGNTIFVKKGEQDLLNALNTALDELINSGFVDQTISKYEKYPNSFRRVAKPYEGEK